MPAVTMYRQDGDPLITSDTDQLRQALLAEVELAEHHARIYALDEPMWPLIELHTTDSIVLTVALRRDRGALYWAGQHGEMTSPAAVPTPNRKSIISAATTPRPAVF